MFVKNCKYIPEMQRLFSNHVFERGICHKGLRVVNTAHTILWLREISSIADKLI